MVYWETAPGQPGQTELTLDFGRVWRAANKIVYSTTLDTVSSARTRIEADLRPGNHPAAQSAGRPGYHRGLRQSGPSQAIKAGLVDEDAT